MSYKLTANDMNNIKVSRLKSMLKIVDSSTTKEQFEKYCVKEQVEISPKLIKLLFDELDEELHNANALMLRFNDCLKAKK